MNDGLEISESELHAYVDGALEADRANAVAARLAADPALAHRVTGFKADMAMLKKVYGPLGDAPVPREWLALVENSRPAAPAYSWRLVGAIAAVLLVAVVLAPFAYRAAGAGPAWRNRHRRAVGARSFGGKNHQCGRRCRSI